MDFVPKLVNLPDLVDATLSNASNDPPRRGAVTMLSLCRGACVIAMSGAVVGCASMDPTTIAAVVLVVC